MSDGIQREAPPAGAPKRPTDRLCSRCGTPHPYVWHTPVARSTGRRFPARWCAPPDPCPTCQGATADSDRPSPVQITRRRVREAGIPDVLSHVGLDSYTVQPPTMPFDTWRSGLGPGQLGVAFPDLPQLARLREWNPRRDPWLLLTGPPGTGKTTALAALASRFLRYTPPVERTIAPPNRPHLRGPGADGLALTYAATRGLLSTTHAEVPPEVRYVRLDELLERERLKWRLDKEPLADVTLAPVLLLDELATSDSPPERERSLVDRLLGWRHDHRRITVVASNTERGKLLSGSVYGQRVASRLGTAVHVVLGTVWRA